GLAGRPAFRDGDERSRLTPNQAPDRPLRRNVAISSPIDDLTRAPPTPPPQRLQTSPFLTVCNQMLTICDRILRSLTIYVRFPTNCGNFGLAGDNDAVRVSTSMGACR